MDSTSNAARSEKSIPAVHILGRADAMMITRGSAAYVAMASSVLLYSVQNL